MKCEKKNLLKKEKKKKKIENDFIGLLFEFPTITENTSFREAMILVATDPRYLGISSERERERLFTEFISQKKLKERDEIRIAKQKSIEEFKSYLEENHVTINSQWHKIYEYSKDSDIVKTLGNLECINVYTEYMKKNWKKMKKIY